MPSDPSSRQFMLRPIHSTLLAGLLSLLPAAWLWQVWPSIPALVPYHFGIDGVADHFTGRQWLWNIAWWPAMAFVVFTFLPQVHAGESLFWSSPRQRLVRGLLAG